MQENNLPRPQLGRLETVDPRQIWLHEEREFTPWLADNINQLSETIGIPLKVQQVEQRVGNYQLDIFAQDENSESVVIIENQLEETDHRHLGQVMTYAAGLDAKIIIWIATSIRDEHRLAMEWLNRNMGDEVSFFLVRLDVVRIGDSLPAVRFISEVEPSRFERTLDTLRARTPAITPSRMIWSDTPNNPVLVSSWKAVLRSTLERTIRENFSLHSLGLRTTTDEDEAEEYRAHAYFEAQQTYVDTHGSARDMRKKVNTVLKSMGKPDAFLTIECNDGTVFTLPGQA
ncbi:MAG TPA: hypothetical protein VKA60_06035 [Blastocatellia bacterium]|nr:hypothetical protein [Blastocatellia bacterium]